MKWQLLSVCVLWVLFAWANKHADHGEVDDWSAAIVALLLAGTAVLDTVAYLLLAFWNHRFL